MAHHRLRGKPAVPKESPHHPGHCNASMGIYIFNTQLLIPILLADSRIPNPTMILARTFFRASFRSTASLLTNFVDETPKMLSTGAMSARSTPTTKPTWTRQCVACFQPLRHFLAAAHLAAPVSAAKFVFADPERMGVALDSIVAGGSVISGGRVQKSVIGNNVRVNSYSEVSDSIIYNHVNIGRHSRIRRAIIDRHVSLPERTEIGYDLEADRRRFHVSDSGIVVVVRQESLIEEPNPPDSLCHLVWACRFFLPVAVLRSGRHRREKSLLADACSTLDISRGSINHHATLPESEIPNDSDNTVSLGTS